MRAFAFLDRDQTDYLTGLRWPLAVAGGTAPWVEGPGVRACGVEQLPWWLDEELWEVELEGGVEDAGRSLRADRGRLLGRVEAWTAAVADELRHVCLARIRDTEVLAAGTLEASRLSGFTADAARFADEAPDAARAAGVVAYVAAHVVAGADEHAPGYGEAFARERRSQAEWLRNRLQLST